MTPTPARKRFSRKLLFTFLACLIIGSIMAVSLELLLRFAGIPYKILWVPSENGIARFDPALGWSYIPGLSKDVRFAASTAPVHFDRNGIRVLSPATQLSPIAPAILFIGCSFTMGDGLAYEDSFPGHLEKLDGDRYQMVNLGVQSYGTDQAMLALKKFAPQFNSRIVVYTFLEDHILRNGVADRRLIFPKAIFPGTKPLFALDGRNRLYQAKTPRLYRNYINSYLYDSLQMAFGPQFGTFPPFPVETTMEMIREMKRYCDEHNIRFLLINWRFTGYDFSSLTNLDVDVIDTLDHAPPGWAGMKIPGDEHPNSAANRHVADLIHRYIEYIESRP